MERVLGFDDCMSVQSSLIRAVHLEYSVCCSNCVGVGVGVKFDIFLFCFVLFC